LVPSGFIDRSLVITAGAPAAPGQVEVGNLLAQRLHLRPRDTIVLNHRQFVVSGTFHSGTAYIDTGAVTTLHDAQVLAGHTSDEVTIFAVRLAPAVSTQEGE